MNEGKKMRASWLTIAVLGVAACTGTISEQPSGQPIGDSVRPPGAPPPSGSTGGSKPGESTASFECQAAAQNVPSPMRRLTALQLRNTVGDVLALLLKDTTLAAEALRELGPQLDRLPPDPRGVIGNDKRGSFKRLTQDVQLELVEATYDLAQAIGRAVTRPDRLRKVVGDCAEGTGPAGDCLRAFLGRVAERILRTPLDPATTALLTNVYGDLSARSAQGFADVVSFMLTLPQFFYLMESGATEVPGRPGVRRLSGFELANRLSYHLWNTMPDTRLWEAARSGTLATPEGLGAEVERVFSDPKTTATLEAFYREWLRLDDLAPLHQTNADARYRAVATYGGRKLPTETLHRQMTDEVMDMVMHYTKAGSFDDLLVSQQGFARGAELARDVYGLPGPMVPGGAPVSLGPERPGLLTRAALLASPSSETRPILRGAVVRRSFLCEEIPDPPPDAMQDAEMLEQSLPADATTRQKVEHLTETSTACRACHQTLINPLGFALEGFDALGRLRTVEPIVDEKGTVRKASPVDTRAVPRIEASDPRPATGAAELLRMIRDSRKAHACFARQYVRYTFGRVENTQQDGCALASLTGALVGGASLKEVFKAVVLTPAFAERRFE